MNLQELSASEKILLAEQLWDSVRAEADASELNASQRKVLAERLAEYELEPEQGESWDSVKAQIITL
ncbi:addiction module protein [Rheinheimera soli]|uniref:addiction module protein n=1 Tax=Rheinheimera soli TaxID=443616 RepID=UPI001E5779CA|nr:addiction module protein [Rheinheimera soli]